MNEQINGLWWKARIGYNNQSCDPEVLEKFAELIVRECVEVMKQHSFHQRTQNAVLEHFGVK